MAHDEEAAEELEAFAAAQLSESEHEHVEGDLEVCPQCQRPLDDIEAMSEEQLLSTIRIGLLKDIARGLRSGTATHQEKAIARGLLRDSGKALDPGDDTDEQAPQTPQGRTVLPRREFPDYRGTDGG